MMRANRWWPLALGVGAYLAFLIVSFPASTAYRWFVPQSLRLTGIEGTFWSGRAAAGSFEQIVLQDLRWRGAPWQLLLGGVAADFEARLPDGFVGAHVSGRPSALRLTNVRLGTSLSMLQGLVPIGGTRGQATVNLSEVVLTDGWPTNVIGELRLGKPRVPPLAGSARQRSFRSATISCASSRPPTSRASPRSSTTRAVRSRYRHARASPYARVHDRRLHHRAPTRRRISREGCRS
jgi:hypothetical protein